MKILFLLLILGAGLYFYLNSKHADPQVKKEVETYTEQLKAGVQKAQDASKKAGEGLEKLKTEAAKNLKKAEEAKKVIAADVEEAKKHAKKAAESARKIKDDAKAALKDDKK